MRGIYTAGVLDVLMENGITVDGVIGVSAGAIHGCSYVSGQHGRSIRYYRKYMNDYRFMSFRSLLLTGNLVGTDFCYHEIPEKLDAFDFDSFEKSRTDFYVTCTNVETGKAEYIHMENMKEIDYMRASASMPLVSEIVEVHGKKYLDGGVADSIPVDAFRSMGYGKSVVVLTRQASYRKSPENMRLIRAVYRKYPAFVKAMENRSAQYNRTVERIRELERRGEIVVIRPTKDPGIGRMEKNPQKVQAVYDLGRSDAQKKLLQVKRFLNA